MDKDKGKQNNDNDEEWWDGYHLNLLFTESDVPGKSESGEGKAILEKADKLKKDLAKGERILEKLNEKFESQLERIGALERDVEHERLKLKTDMDAKRERVASMSESAVKDIELESQKALELEKRKIGLVAERETLEKELERDKLALEADKSKHRIDRARLDVERRIIEGEKDGLEFVNKELERERNRLRREVHEEVVRGGYDREALLRIEEKAVSTR